MTAPQDIHDAGSAPVDTASAGIEVFDPPMCCSTGVCGPSVDPQLARFEADLRWLSDQGAKVTRYNLAQEPGEFVARSVVAAMLASGGEGILPVVLINGKLHSCGSHPSRADLAAALGIAAPTVGANLLAPSTCCAPSGTDQGGCC